MRDKRQMEKRLYHALVWRVKCEIKGAPGYPLWEREAETLKWALGIRNEEKFLRSYKAEGNRQGQEKK